MNYLKKYMGAEGDFRAFIVETTEIGQELFSRLQPYPVSLNILTQAVTSALLMACDMKTRGTISLKAVGDGPIRHVTAEANTDGEARGYCGEPHLQFEKEEDSDLLVRAVGSGDLTVRRRVGSSGHLYTSIVKLQPLGWAGNMTHYYSESEQLSSGMKLGVELDSERGIKGSGGLLIMAMPEAKQMVLNQLDLNVRNLLPLGTYFNSDRGFDELRKDLFLGLKAKEMSSQAVCYRCNCTSNRVLNILQTLPQDEKLDMREKNEPVSINCAFCSKKYTFQPEDIFT